MKYLFLCDKQIAAILGCSTSTVSRAANGKLAKNDLISSVKPIYVGGARRWRTTEVSLALGISVEEIESILNR